MHERFGNDKHEHLEKFIYLQFLVNISHQKTPIVVTTILMWRVVLGQGVNG
jgi:hypothetical protein